MTPAEVRLENNLNIIQETLRRVMVTQELIVSRLSVHVHHRILETNNLPVSCRVYRARNPEGPSPSDLWQVHKDIVSETYDAWIPHNRLPQQ